MLSACGIFFRSAQAALPAAIGVFVFRCVVRVAIVVVDRDKERFPSVLLIAQPTRGVDVGAIEFIHARILEKRNEGCAILLCSADLDEVFRLSDRVITMYEGRITGEFSAAEISREEIGYCMTGGRREEAQA